MYAIRSYYEMLKGNEKVVAEDSNDVEQVKLLYRGIARLNHIDKAIILLWLEDKSYEEIAEVLGTSSVITSYSIHYTKLYDRMGYWM